MDDTQDLTQGISGATDSSQSGVPPQVAPMPSQTGDDDDGQPDDDEDTTPKPSTEPAALATKDNDEHMQIVGKNDEHVAALTTDPDMLQHMQQMNAASNQTNPPSNGGGFGSSMGSGMSVGIGVTQGGMGMGGMSGGMGMGGMSGGMGMGGMSGGMGGQMGGQMGMGVVVQGNMTSAGNNAAQGADVLVANTNEDWINKKWRPVMGWMYMGVCVFDFVIAPILWSIVQAMAHGAVNVQWQPLTLQGAGLFHVAMGAVLGIAAYGRTQEKIQGVSAASTTTPTPVGIAPPAPMAPTGLANPSLPNSMNSMGGMGMGGMNNSTGIGGFH